MQLAGVKVYIYRSRVALNRARKTHEAIKERSPGTSRETKGVTFNPEGMKTKRALVGSDLDSFEDSPVKSLAICCFYRAESVHL
jgi:hypothetical protein